MLAVTALALPSGAPAQRVRARVVEAKSLRPIAGVSAFIADTSGAIARSGITNDAGRVDLRAPSNRELTVTLRHIGHSPVTVRQPPLAESKDVELVLEMVRVDFLLDTVHVVAPRKKPWYADISDGRDLFLKHYHEGKGVFIGGREIEASGMPLSEFLSQVPGLILSNVRPTAGPFFTTTDGRFLTSDRGSKCLVIKSDRPNQYGGIDGLDLMTIMGVEIYRDLREVPAEWRFEAWPSGGRAPCGYVRVWTTIAW